MKMTIGQKLKFLREERSKTQQEVCKALSIEQSTLANYENDKRVPKIDILTKIAEYYKVPTDYILGVGTFENWDMLIEQKQQILEQISNVISRLSIDMMSGLDDISFAKLVFAFDVSVQKHSDGIGISVKDPIPTYSSSLIKGNTDNLVDNSEWLSLIHALPEEDQRDLLGMLRMWPILHKTSVAADKPEKKVVGK